MALCVKCETDLPESLRLGRVQVSCEGWSGPGDPYVLKGVFQSILDSCSTALTSGSRVVLSGVPPPGGAERLEGLYLSAQVTECDVHLYALPC
jgi:hypothetical protein